MVDKTHTDSEHTSRKVSILILYSRGVVGDGILDYSSVLEAQHEAENGTHEDILEAAHSPGLFTRNPSPSRDPFSPPVPSRISPYNFTAPPRGWTRSLAEQNLALSWALNLLLSIHLLLLFLLTAAVNGVQMFLLLWITAQINGVQVFPLLSKTAPVNGVSLNALGNLVLVQKAG